MKIGIIGLGLIGGSILKSLSGKGFELIGITRNQDTLRDAKQFCAKASENIQDLKNCDVIFVCTPISKTLETLDDLEKIVSKNCIVADVASVKNFVMQKKYTYKFIGSHPMAGLETCGFWCSTATLFEGAKWVLTPPEGTDSADLGTLENILKLTGAKIITTNAKDHDEAVAFISHLPMLIAQGMFKNTENNTLALKLASSGFRDSTRLAMTNKFLAQDMLNYNKQNILNAFENFTKEFLNLINDENYFDTISEIALNRTEMYSKDGKNIY